MDSLRKVDGAHCVHCSFAYWNVNCGICQENKPKGTYGCTPQYCLRNFDDHLVLMDLQFSEPVGAYMRVDERPICLV